LRAKKKSDENFPPLSSDDQRPSAFGVTATPLQNKEDEGDDGDGQNKQGRMEEGREREGEKIKNHFQKKVSIINCETLAVIKFKKPAHTAQRSALCSTTADRSSI